MPGSQAGGFCPPTSNMKNQPMADLIFFSAIKLPMYPQSVGGKSFQTSFNLNQLSGCSEISDNEANGNESKFNQKRQKRVTPKKFADLSEISHPATKLDCPGSPSFTINDVKNTKFLSVLIIKNKYNICKYLYNLIVSIIFFFSSRYNFFDFLGMKAVESGQGVAGTLGDKVSTPVKTGHGVHPVRVYTGLNQRANFIQTTANTYHGTSSILSDICCLSIFFIMLRAISAFSDYIKWPILYTIFEQRANCGQNIAYICCLLLIFILPKANFALSEYIKRPSFMVHNYFRKNFCAITDHLHVRKSIVHRWVSTGLYILGR